MSPTLPALARLNEKYQIIVASGSPRRKEILTKLGLEFRVAVSTFPEDLDKSLYTPDEYVLQTALGKATEVYRRVRRSNNLTEDHRPILVIAADTVVIHNERIIEKPISNAHAKEMLRGLAGREHVVATAIVLAYAVDEEGNLKVETAVERSKVLFDEMDDELIDAYVATGEPLDKAGGYGYQGLAAAFIPRIDGCYYNVIGFPVNRFVRTATNLLNTQSGGDQQ
ncbi:N-acetylserotonin O-methyltransferase-like protein-like protein [Fimicolochytrium jonesii]|uniref:N-acetylserotonin O-methyltransferase-like protein-like protein n=1 Tax=Fimicolochytrium jonesii TaxID=1396493 RepID=UPI0022FE9DCE|nr:N-acetylserotonin O-methyltransferase-like protein-like protein [Fimicolochytrium jonesii]KAI8817198.1 N-acetylserotonin O-methyltransferase-like protein-like protein [Fimicolochytrium jonesii]